MTFPLGAWIDEHLGCRHNLALSGMKGTVPPTPDPRDPGSAEELREALARELGVPPERLFLTHGATEANFLVATFLRGRLRMGAPVCRVRLPEYPPLVDMPRSLGYRVATSERPAVLAVSSQPRNPEGDLWTQERLFTWADGAAHLLVDETFRKFGPARSLATAPRGRLWVTGTFTKFYGGDDLRVGYTAAPVEEARAFGRFHGAAADEVAPRSIAGALALLRRGSALVGQVRSIVERNRRALRAALPRTPAPVGPVHFDRGFAEASDPLAHRCLAASVLVCPGRFFGDPSGIRICLTRRSFPVDLAAYLAVRNGSDRRRRPTAGATRGARPRRGGYARTPAGRG